MATPEELLHDLDDPQKRIAAILALGEMAHAPALDRILSFVRDDDPQVRRAVMLALASFEGDRVMAAIVAGLHDSNDEVRAAVQSTWAKQLLKNMLKLANADRGYVVLKNPDTGAMEYCAGEKVTAEALKTPEFHVSQTVVEETTRTQESILTDNASADNRFQGAEGIVGFSLRQIAAVPLKSGDEVIGVIYMDKRLRDGFLKPDDLAMIDGIAETAVKLIEFPLAMAEPPGGVEGGDEDDEFMMDDLRGGGAQPDEPFEEAEVAKEESAPPPKPISPITPQEEPAASEVNFSAYYPAQAVAEKQQGLYVYAHLPDLAPTIEQDVKQFKEQLGGTVPTPRVAKQTAQLKHGTLITVTPECDDLEFDPVAVTKKWNGEWTRFDFAFMPKAAMVSDSLFVRVSISVSGVEIAHIKCPIEVVKQTAAPVEDANPLAAAKLATQTARMYHRVFVSYSRKDAEVAEAYRLAQIAIGNDVFMDSYSIRVGEDWRAALARAIDDADIFQLFWSNHSAESENVHDEWDYALKYKCPDQNCTYFIRPVFWTKPMPHPPQELSHLNFRFVPLEGGKETDG